MGPQTPRSCETGWLEIQLSQGRQRKGTGQGGSKKSLTKIAVDNKYPKKEKPSPSVPPNLQNPKLASK